MSGRFYRYRPPPPLADFVDVFWYFEGSGSAHAKERLLPTGTIELVINLGEDETRTFDPQDTKRCCRGPGSVIIGAHSGCFVIDTSMQQTVVGVHFRPGG